jgi:uncharacterized membrane protein YdbT with pleckstrin-like domain
MAMSYVDSLLGEGERILYFTRHHWVTLLGRVIWRLVLLALGVAAATLAILYGGQAFAALGPDPLVGSLARGAIVALLVAYPIVSIVVSYVSWRGDRFIVTNFRVIHIEGILSKSVIDSSLEKVNDVALEQSVLGRLLDYGNVEIMTSSEIGVNRLRRIGHPLAFKKAMLDAKNDVEDPRRGGVESLPQVLSELAALRDRGILTEQEYQTKKTELLRAH